MWAQSLTARSHQRKSVQRLSVTADLGAMHEEPVCPYVVLEALRADTTPKRPTREMGLLHLLIVLEVADLDVCPARGFECTSRGCAAEVQAVPRWPE